MRSPIRPDLGVTPAQTVGPYLAISMHQLITPELIEPGDPRAIRLRGTLLDGDGVPVPDGMVEIWQANAAGRYAHPADERAEIALEEGFLGFGRSGTVNGGTFEFVTLKPGRVPWPEGGLQAPHLQVAAFARGLLKHVVTRIYFPDEDGANAVDPVLSRLDEGARSRLIAVADGDGLRFDIRLQGPEHTPFFAV
jgi:protocatechuate 3,4-dioxygenase alpha subunit